MLKAGNRVKPKPIADLLSKGALNEEQKRVVSAIALSQFVVSAMPSFSMFDDPFLRAWISSLGATRPVPHRTLVTNTMDHYFDVLSTAMLAKLQDIDSVSVTTDAATLSLTQHPFIAITGHFIQSTVVEAVRRWKLHHVALAVELAPGSHTAGSIAGILDRCFAKWGLSDRIHGVVSDNGANFVAAVNILSEPRDGGTLIEDGYRCAAHTVQLVVHDAIMFKQKRNAIVPIPSDHAHHYIRKVNNACVFIRAVPIRTERFKLHQKNELRNSSERLARRQIALQLESMQADELLAMIGDIDDELVDPSDSDSNGNGSGSSDNSAVAAPASVPVDNWSSYQSSHDADRVTTRAFRLALRNATRWNSAYLMLLRFVLWVEVVNSTLEDFNAGETMKFKPEEVTIISELIKILRPCKDFTVAVQSATVPSLSMVWPQLQLLDADLQDAGTEITSIVAKNTLNKLRTRLRERFKFDSVNDSNKTAIIASLLDPRSKSITFSSEAQKSFAWMSLKELFEREKDRIARASEERRAASSNSQQPVQQSGAAAPERPRKRKLADLMEKSAPSRAEDPEWLQYQMIQGCETEEDPLRWWADHESHFPVIAMLARRFLSIPASSAPSERIFSLAAAIATKSRNLLSTARLSKMIFCKQNQNAIKDLQIDLVKNWQKTTQELVDGFVEVCALIR